MIDLKKISSDYPWCLDSGEQMRVILKGFYPKEKARINILATMLSEGVKDVASKNNGLAAKRFCGRICDEYGFSASLVVECYNCFAAYFGGSPVDDCASQNNNGASAYPTINNCDRSDFEIDGTVLKKYKGKARSVEIPDGVTEIGEFAFYENETITAVAIPNSVKTIGRQAFFRCTELTEITIPSSVTVIGSSAFDGCGLTDVVLSDGLKEIGTTAFAGCRFTSIVIPKSVKTIAAGTFQYCTYLRRLDIPVGVETVGIGAFVGCYGLTLYCELSSPPSGWEGATNTTCPVIWNCKNNDKDRFGRIPVVADEVRYSLEDGHATVIRQPHDLSGDIKLRSSIAYKGKTYRVTRIMYEAFKCCDKITSVTIPDSVQRVEENAFDDCESLTCVGIGRGVTDIEKCVFAGCKALTRIRYNGTKAMWDKIRRVPYWCDRNKNIQVYCKDGATANPADENW